MHNMLDFSFATPDEVCRELGAKLKVQRLAKGWTQVELASRARIAKGTLQRLEAKGVATFESLVRVVMALDLVDQLQPLFDLQIKSIAQMEAAEQVRRQRAPRKRSSS